MENFKEKCPPFMDGNLNMVEIVKTEKRPRVVDFQSSSTMEREHL